LLEVLRTAFFGFSILIVLIILPVYADTTGIKAILNKNSYQVGDKVTISGSISQPIGKNPVTIIVRNPMANVYDVGQEDLVNNLFVHDFVISENSLSGAYMINIKYVNQTTQLHFTINESVLTTIQVLDSQIKVRTNGTNPVKYGDVSISQSEKKITIPIDTSNVTTSFVNQQYQIPKKIIDTPGGEIILKVDRNQMLCAQSETNSMRILDCTIPSDTKEIEFIGTTVIPEFGPFVGLSISLSIIAVVIISRTKFHF
jgi:hypothetical protein